MQLIDILIRERKNKTRNGLYRQTQILMAYHSNRIEGSTCSLEETSLLFDTSSYGVQNPSNDITETFNHFRAFDMIIDTYKQKLSEEYIKAIHGIVKFNSEDEKRGYAIGDYKKIPNRVGTLSTTKPENVSRDISTLLENYNNSSSKKLEDLLDFHIKFEQIHPFQDGNGRVGRLIMFKECLRNKIKPFIISSDNNLAYKACLMAFQLKMNNAMKNFVDFAKQEQLAFDMVVKEIQAKGR